MVKKVLTFAVREAESVISAVVKAPGRFLAAIGFISEDN